MRQVMADLELLAFDQVKVVEKPFRRRNDGMTTPDVLRIRPIRPAQNAAVIIEARTEATRPLTGSARERESSGEGTRPRLEGFGAQKRAAMRNMDRRHGSGRTTDA